tara:strand:+ start:1481 stop:2149 length:669 start_codon:yes stop_codon:yes gene_type:complete
MPPKKPKKTEETLEEIQEEIIENVIQEEQEHEEEETDIQKPPPKKKRVLSEAQKANFNKLQEANKIRYEARKAASLANGIAVKPKPPKGSNVNKDIIANKDEYIKKEITKKKAELSKVNKQIEEVSSSDEEAEVQVVKKKKKKKKPRIIVEEDSSDSDQEIVISRRRKNKKPIAQPIPTAPIDIPGETHKEEAVEKEKIIKNKKEPVLKDYTHQQILKGLGL